MKKDSILKATLILTIGSVVGKVLGFVRELAVAYRFGAGSITDAFVLTNGIPTLLFASVGTAVSINYIPCLQSINDDEQQNIFTSNLLNLIIVVLLIGSAIVCTVPQIVLKIFATGLPAETEKYAVVMLRIVIFSIFPIIMAHLFQGYSQIKGMFITTALSGIVTNCVMIVMSLISTEESYWLLSIGTVSANLLGMLLTYFGARKGGYRYYLQLYPKNDDIKRLLILSLPLVLEDVASSMSLLVDRNLASFLDKGTISGLSYAGTIGNIASTMIATAVITATFPTFSKMLAQGEKRCFLIQFEKYAAAISYVLGPVSIFMIMNADDIVALIFEHGAFNNTATKIVAESMSCYAVGILPLGLQTYLIRGFYAMQDTKNPVKIKVFSLICNIVLNLILVQFMAHMGIALSTSISYAIAYFMLTYVLKKKHGIQNIWAITKESGISIFISILPAGCLFFVFNYILIFNNIVFKLLVEGGAFLGLYIMILMLFRKDKLQHMLKS